MWFPKQQRISVHFVLERRERDYIIRIAFSTASSRRLCVRAETLRITMGPAANRFTERSSMMKTSNWSTPKSDCSRWPMPGQIPMDRSSLSPRCRAIGWMENTVCNSWCGLVISLWWWLYINYHCSYDFGSISSDMYDFCDDQLYSAKWWTDIQSSKRWRNRDHREAIWKRLSRSRTAGRSRMKMSKRMSDRHVTWTCKCRRSFY